MIFNRVTSGAANDIEQATKLTRSMVTRYGMSDEFEMMALETVSSPYLYDSTTLLVSPETAAKIDDEVQNIIETRYNEAMDILEENKEKLHEISKYLYENESITGDEFKEILKAKTPEKAEQKVEQ